MWSSRAAERGHKVVLQEEIWKIFLVSSKIFAQHVQHSHVVHAVLLTKLIVI